MDLLVDTCTQKIHFFIPLIKEVVYQKYEKNVVILDYRFVAELYAGTESKFRSIE